MEKGTVLVVDDDAFFRHQYGNILSDAGYRVLTAASAEEALDILPGEAIDVMLTDMVLPGASGLELLREVRRRESPPEVILVTGHATIETAINALKTGARDYLVKPFDPEVLLHDVHTSIEQRRLLNENLHLKRQIRLFTAGQDLAALIDMERLLKQALTSLQHEVANGRAFSFLRSHRSESEVVAAQGIDERLALSMVERLMMGEFECAGIQALSGEAFKDLPDPDADVRQVYLFPLQ